MSKIITGSESATPFFKYNEDGYGETVVLYAPDGSKQFLPYEAGLTIRQEFAARAMQGILAGMACECNPEAIAKDSVNMADALINELNKQP